MINTVNTVNSKAAQLRDTYFKIGTGAEVILIIGSCRCVPLCNYFNTFNEHFGDIFTIAFIDPYNFHYDINDNRIDLEVKINSLETDDRLLDLLKSVKVFIHEFYNNFGMFNCDKNAAKNIYQFGLKPEIDICLPNWNDCFVLCGDIVSMDMDIRKKAIADYNVIGKLSEQTFNEMCAISNAAIEKFKKVCLLSDIPEMWKYFADNFRVIRFAHNSNHVTKHFTLFIFAVLADRLNINISDNLMEEISRVDMYDNSFTSLTTYDIACHNYQWSEHIKELKELL